MTELMLKCRQETDLKGLVCHTLEEDVTSMIWEVTGMENVMGLGRGGEDKIDDKEDNSDISVVFIWFELSRDVRVGPDSNDRS